MELVIILYRVNQLWQALQFLYGSIIFLDHNDIVRDLIERSVLYWHKKVQAFISAQFPNSQRSRVGITFPFWSQGRRYWSFSCQIAINWFFCFLLQAVVDAPNATVIIFSRFDFQETLIITGQDLRLRFIIVIHWQIWLKCWKRNVTCFRFLHRKNGRGAERERKFTTNIFCHTGKSQRFGFFLCIARCWCLPFNAHQ